MQLCIVVCIYHEGVKTISIISDTYKTYTMSVQTFAPIENLKLTVTTACKIVNVHIVSDRLFGIKMSKYVYPYDVLVKK